MKPGPSLGPPAALLAQAARKAGQTDVGVVVAWSAGLIVALVVGLWVAMRVKRRLQQPDEPTTGVGFTLSDLRQLHRNGQMTDEEFERAKAKVVEAARRASERDRAASAAKAGGLSGLPPGPAGFPVMEAKPPPGGVGEPDDEAEDDDADEEPPPGRR